MKKNNLKNAIRTCLILLASMGSLGMTAFAASDYGPGNPKTGDASYMEGVTEAMLSADAWVGSPEYKKVLMTPNEIESFNQNNFSTKEVRMFDLKTLPETFNGIELRSRQIAFNNPKNLYINDQAVPASYYEAIRSNIAGISVSESMPVHYGIIANRTVMKQLPYSEFLSDAIGDPEWDNLVNSALLVNEPVLVYYASADRRFYYVQGEICDGWVPSEDLVLCHSREEWLAAQTHTSFLVVTGESITTEASTANASHSQRDFDMGTVLELAGDFSSPEFVDNRMSWYSYIVLVPGRGADGLYEAQKALIPVNRDVHVGFLPFTQENLIRLSMKCLGNRYGWGGMLDSQDCSAYVRELYLCFGMKLPRNTTWQSQMPVKVLDISEKTDAEKEAILSQTAPGAILQFPGHEMLMLSQKNGEFFVINDVSSLVLGENENAVKYRARAVILNGLKSTKRANGKSWLQALTKIIIPWENAN